MNAPAAQPGATARPGEPLNRASQAEPASWRGGPQPAASDEGLPGFDWLTGVVIPACIIGLLGSFLYYLVELRGLVGGGASGQLKWVCFFFTLGVVLITRIRMTFGRAAIALPYVVGLGLAVAVFVYVFTMSSGSLLGKSVPGGRLLDLMFNYALVGVLWYGAHRLTAECTAGESMAQSDDRGLLTDLAARGGEGSRLREGARRGARHPGRLVMWFSLAAVAVFALGHRAAIAVYGRSSKFAFECMAAYLFFALALLALTSLSAVRMHVFRRRLGMSKAVGPAWILVAMLLVGAVLMLARALPREGASGPAPVARLIGEGGEGLQRGRSIDFPVGGVRERAEASRHRRGPQEAPEAAGGAAGASSEEEGRAEAAVGGAGGGSGEGARSGGPGGEGRGEGEGRTASRDRGVEPTPGADFNWLWLLLLLLLLLLVFYLIIRYRKQIAAWLRRTIGRIRVPEWVLVWGRRVKASIARVLAWLRALNWGRRLAARARGLDERAVRDPFADRDLSGKPAAQKVIHVYHALLAYAEMLGCPRRSDQTPLEYARDLPHGLASLGREVRELTGLYIQARYTQFPITDEQVSRLQGIWRELQRRIDEALALSRPRVPARETGD